MLSAQLQSFLRAIPSATRIREDWGENRIAVDLKIDPDRAAINAVTNQDVAQSSMMNTSGLTAGTFYDQDKSVPIVLRQRLGSRCGIRHTGSLCLFDAEWATGTAQGCG